jgi:hypothetical protein
MALRQAQLTDVGMLDPTRFPVGYLGLLPPLNGELESRCLEGKKPDTRPGFWFPGSGGRIAFGASRLSYVGRLRRPRNEPASQNPTLPHLQKQPAPMGPALFILVAGVCFVRFRQYSLELE